MTIFALVKKKRCPSFREQMKEIQIVKDKLKGKKVRGPTGFKPMNSWSQGVCSTIVLRRFFYWLQQSKKQKRKTVQQIKTYPDKKSKRFIKRIQIEPKPKKQHHFFLLTVLKQSFSEIRFPSRLQIEKPFPIVIDDWKHLLLARDEIVFQEENRSFCFGSSTTNISNGFPFFL